MSAHTGTMGPGGEQVWHQFEDIEQQNESYVVGMWTFLVTEIMFFGALFLCYVLYRTSYPQVFAECHRHLQVKWGAINTVVLLTSSFSMALSVRAAQLGQRRAQINWMCFTILCAFGFLGIKAIEYTKKFDDHLFPGPTFKYEAVSKSGEPIPEALSAVTQESVAKESSSGGVDQGKAQMFFSLYFCMTGLHGIHVIVGILVMGTMVLMLKFKHPSIQYYIYTELAGLYWHFVDIVWIFLFPLYYLIPG